MLLLLFKVDDVKLKEHTGEEKEKKRKFIIIWFMSEY